ncbi:magnesium transporter [Brucella intermedia]|uniref:magnesium transporter n=1 Tax=Brucella intermedia TaxID=94625 RepID=UPI001FFF2D24|nr:magnesium transporter [Brucella intermedia]
MRDLFDALAVGDFDAVRVSLRDKHSVEIANQITSLDRKNAATCLLLLPERQQAEVFGYLHPDAQVELARIIGRSELAALITAMSHDERADLFKQLSTEQQAALLPGIAHAEREDIRKLGSYPEGTAGAIMTSDYATLDGELTAREAINTLRREAPDKETIYHAYVVDGGRKLIGVVSLRELLVADDETAVSHIMRRNIICSRVDDTKQAVAEKISDYDFLAMPIINDSGVLVGIVTVDDALDEAMSERGRNVAQFGGNVPIRGGPDLSFRTSSFMQIFNTRVFWLSVLTVFGIATSTFVAAQEEILSEIIILAAFIAPIIDAGGNTGSQSATLVIRAMALGEVKMRWRDVWFIVRREIPVVLALGVVIGLLEAVLAFFSKGVGVDVLLVVGLSMGICMILGGLIGATLPFLARRIGTDPATLSSPLITSIMDLLGVVVYFGMAYVFMGHLLAAG